MWKVHRGMPCLPEIKIEHPKADDRRDSRKKLGKDYRTRRALGLHHL
jgi:hypothetical protein